MRQKIRFAVINECKTGVSRSTGMPYSMQQVVVTWDEVDEQGVVRPQFLLCNLSAESITRLATMGPIGQNVEFDVLITFKTESFNGRVRNRVTMHLQ